MITLLSTFGWLRCNGSYNTTDSPFDKIYVSNKTEDVNLSVFNMIIRINGSKILS